MSNTITSTYDLDYPQKEYGPRTDPEKMMAVMCLTFFFVFLFYKIFMFQFLTNDKNDTLIRNLEEHLEIAERNIIDHGLRLETIHENLTDADIASLRDKVQQLREDLNLIALSNRFMTSSGSTTHKSIPVVKSIYYNIVDREQLLSKETFDKYIELAEQTTK